MDLLAYVTQRVTQKGRRPDLPTATSDAVMFVTPSAASGPRYEVCAASLVLGKSKRILDMDFGRCQRQQSCEISRCGA